MKILISIALWVSNKLVRHAIDYIYHIIYGHADRHDLEDRDISHQCFVETTYRETSLQGTYKQGTLYLITSVDKLNMIIKAVLCAHIE